MTDAVSGFYRDDGTRIDPGKVAKPTMCEKCKRDGINKEEEILCILTRSDQEGEERFKCAAFEPKFE